MATISNKVRKAGSGQHLGKFGLQINDWAHGESISRHSDTLTPSDCVKVWRSGEIFKRQCLQTTPHLHDDGAPRLFKISGTFWRRHKTGNQLNQITKSIIFLSMTLFILDSLHLRSSGWQYFIKTSSIMTQTRPQKTADSSSLCVFLLKCLILVQIKHGAVYPLDWSS